MCNVFMLGARGSPAEQPTSEVTFGQLANDRHATMIHPGESNLIPATTNQRVITKYRGSITLIDHQHQNGFVDKNATHVSSTPIPIESGMAYYGDRNGRINVDLGCGTLNVDVHDAVSKLAKIAALSMSDSADDYTLVNWPLESDGSAETHLLTCYANGHEATGGVVLRLRPIGHNGCHLDLLSHSCTMASKYGRTTFLVHIRSRITRYHGH